uniref:Peptidase S1 domain-containing protein n=1 Tax=Biomphalaria glabrata TaxID=6526 RepID=A0A2C9JHE1_BIOGL
MNWPELPLGESAPAVPAKLANEGVSYANTSCIISGWGQTSGSGGSPNTLQQAYILKISRAECNALWSRYGVTITDKHICVYERDATGLAAPSTRIVNGDNAQLFDHPYQVSLQAYSFNSWYHTCGAVLVAPDKVVTAAHCVDKKQARNLRVVVGVHNLFDPPNEYQQTVAVASFRMHENYNGNGNGYPNDIAVITLFTPVTYNRNVQNQEVSGSNLGKDWEFWDF